MRAWVLLSLAIVTEIIGTLFMKWSSLNGSHSGYLMMLGMIACSYILLSFAIKRIAWAWLMPCGKVSASC
jgi:spermidine export protein MdtJ